MRAILAVVFGFLCALAGRAPALAADDVADFYRGKQITILIGSDPGGQYDVAARIMSHYWGKHIPGNPTVIVQNTPGAGGVLALNNMANLSPKDGTVIGAPQSGSALEPVYHLLSADGGNAKFNGSKLQWIGSIEEAVYLFAFWRDSPVHTFDDLLKQEVLVGASTPNTDEFVFSTLTNSLFGTKMKIISGYGSSPEIALAMERGEIAGALNTYSSLMVKRPNWLKDNTVRIVLQLSATPFAPLEGAPRALDLLKNAEDRQVLEAVLAKGKMARPYVMAQDAPPDRVAAIRTAFMETLKDAACAAELSKAGVTVSPVSGEEVQKVVEQVYRTPEKLLARVRGAIGGKG